MKVRQGFVSNSSSSSFTAFVTGKRYDEMDFSSVERAVIESIGLSSCQFEGLEMIVFSSTEGSHDDLEWIKMDGFAQKVLEYTGKNKDPMFEEYKEQYEIACEDIVKKSERHARTYLTSDRYLQEWEFFVELFMEARSSIYKKFQDLKNKNICIVHEENF